jgi:hypothetical protein
MGYVDIGVHGSRDIPAPNIDQLLAAGDRLVRLSAGHIVVADMQTNLMHFYDATGRWLKSVGGTGEGPAIR